MESRSIVRQILHTQNFAVLATMNDRQPYGNLVAFAVSDDLRHIVFATSSNTQKYRNILANNNVAMLIDNRSNDQSDLLRAMAVTALGVASEIKSKQREKLIKSYLSRHRSLTDFLDRANTAIINIVVTDYILARFNSTEKIRVDNTF